MRFKLVLGLMLVVSSCTSLKESAFEQSMALQGTFTCASVAEKSKETPVEADVTRIRCYQDRWEIHGPLHTFTRTLFQTKQCQQVLGKITYEYEGANDQTACQFVKMNAGWTAENKGACMLNELKPMTKVSLKALAKCPEHTPSFCLRKTNQLEFTSIDPEDAADTSRKLSIKDQASYQQVCSRYQEH